MATIRDRARNLLRSASTGASDSEATVATALQLYGPLFSAQREHVEVISSWHDGTYTKPSLPSTARQEAKDLMERTPTPWGRLIVASTSQGLAVDSVTDEGSSDAIPQWNTLWRPNGFEQRQIAVHDAALTHGISYVLELPGIDPVTRRPRTILRGRSAKRFAAFYDPDEDDEFPTWGLDAVLERKPDGETQWRFEMIDEQNVYRGLASEDWQKVTKIDHYSHGSVVPPIVRFSNKLDLDGESKGEIEPFIPLLGRIDQDTFDRLIVQRFGSWRVRWIAGMEKPKSLTGQRAAAAELGVTDILISDSKDTRFGTFDPTELRGYIDSRDADIRDLAATSQTPPHHLLGQMANLSAEALAAAEASLMRKIDERKRSFGESWEQVFRLGAHLDGDASRASSYSMRVRWRDTESRSLAQTVDALGKMASQLNVPVEMLWGQVPFWTDADTEEAKRLIKSGTSIDALIADLQATMEQDRADQAAKAAQSASAEAPTDEGDE